MQVDTSVAEADVGKLADKMEATFVVDAFPDERFKGTIRQIRNAAQTQQNVVTYDAVIDVVPPGPFAVSINTCVVPEQRRKTLRFPTTPRLPGLTGIAIGSSALPAESTAPAG